jgi:hypothetical protein
MDEQRFDAALRALGQASSRRQAVAGVLAALFGGRRLAAADTGTGKDRSKGKDRNRSTGTGKPGAEGPCGNGSRKANICTRNKDCCTGLCNTKAGKTNKDGRGRCRCVPRGAACRESRNCCNRLSCRDGVCATGGSGCTTDRDCTGATDTCTGGTCTCGGGAACAGGTPICSSGMCVACATDSDCSGVTPFCCVGSCAAVVWGNQTTFGSQGFDPNQFYQPPGVALSGDGLTAAVADTGNHRISVWTRTTATGTDWTPQTTFGSDSYGGSGSTEFDFPNAVALTGDGLTAVVADTNNYRISVWTRPGTTGGDATNWTNQTTFGGEGTAPNKFFRMFSVALTGDGLTVAVADVFNRRISVWTRTTATGTEWTNQTTFGTYGLGPSEFNLPYGVALSVDGLTAVVADPLNVQISVWTRPGTTGGDATNWTNQTTFGDRDGPGPGQFTNPAGVALSVDGLTVAVADPGNNRISVWTRTTATGTDWTPQTTFGSQGSDPNQFSGPRGVALSVDGRTAVIADLNNNRISVWTITCPAEPVIA